MDSQTQSSTSDASSPSSDSSDSSQASSSAGDGITDEQKAALGSLAGLKATLESFENGLPSITEVVSSSSDKTSYLDKTVNTTASFTAHSFKEVITTKTTAATTTETVFNGDKDGVYYAFDFGGSFNSYSRSLVTEKASHALDTITSAKVKEDLAANQKEAVTSSMLFGEIIDNYSKITVNSSFNLKLAGEDKDKLRVSFTAYSESSYNNYTYEYIANFDLSFRVLSGSLTKTCYNSDSWDKTTHAPNDGASSYEVEKSSIASIKYSAQTDDCILPLSEDELAALRITSISGLSVTSSTGSGSDTEANKPEAGRELYLNDSNAMNPYTFLPETAEDSSSIQFLSFSDETVATIDEFGRAKTSEGSEGKTVTATIGNSFYSLDIELTIVKNSDLKYPSFDETPAFALLDSSKGNIVRDTYYNQSITLNVLNEKVIIKGTTTNAAPFDEGLSYGDSEAPDNSVVTIDFLSDQSSYISQYGSDGVYFGITLLVDPASTLYFSLSYKSFSVGAYAYQPIGFAIDYAAA